MSFEILWGFTKEEGGWKQTKREGGKKEVGTYVCTYVGRKVIGQELGKSVSY